jgi:hypothetical protein
LLLFRRFISGNSSFPALLILLAALQTQRSNQIKTTKSETFYLDTGGVRAYLTRLLPTNFISGKANATIDYRSKDGWCWMSAKVSQFRTATFQKLRLE